MHKSLEEYVKEFVNHLRDYNKSEKTVQNYTIAIRKFLCDIVVGGLVTGYKMKYTPKTLTYTYLKDYTRRIKEECNPNTQKPKLCGIKRYLKFIRAKYDSDVYDIYEKEKYRYNDNDEDILKPEPSQEKFKDILTDEEVEKFYKITKYNPRNHALIKTFCYTGQRIHSIVNLNVDDIDFTPRYTKKGIEYYLITIRYRKGKDKPPKDIPVSPECIKAIREYLEVREKPKQVGYYLDDYRRKLYHRDSVFLNGKGQRLRIGSINQMISRYSARLGITKKVHPHLFRHTTITNMDSAGMTDAEMKGISGHSKNSNAIETYKNPIMDTVVEKSLQALEMNHQIPKPIPTKPDNEIIPKEPVQQPIQSSDDKETRLFNAYQQGLITKSEFLRLMEEESINNQPTGYL